MQATQNIVKAYTEAFGKCYPHHKLEVRGTRMRDGTHGWKVIINGDQGERPLTDSELASATIDFLK
jgi:hypothetical protein